MAAGAAEMMLQCVIYAGSISRFNLEIKQRPYHRDCRFALYNLKGVCSHVCSQQRNVSFPKNRSPRNNHGMIVRCPYQLPNTLSIPASKYSTQPSFLSNSSIRNREDTNEVSSQR